ncbi:hypothetical protein [Deinococcus yunweiensis]|uniref:hypothetical protein n=1 Tax=Deinococcus yunweiensis TaxID=367282 RepID=UPI00398E6B59
MTKTEVLAMPYYDGLKWHRDVGQPFDTTGLDERTVAKLREKGYLLTAAAFKARTNPEAAQAQQQVEAQQAELGSLYTLFPGVSTVDGLVQAISALRGQVPGAEQIALAQGNAEVVAALTELYPAVSIPELVGAVKVSRDTAAQVPSAELAEMHSSNATTVAALQALYPDVMTEGLLDAVKASRDSAAQSQALLTVHAATGGTELPPNFFRRGKLAALGLTTYESLQGKTVQQLNAVEGVTTEDAGKIVSLVEAHFAQQE